MSGKGQLIAGIDCGTTGTRSMIFDIDGKALARSYEEFPMERPEVGIAMQNAEDWWRTTCNTLKEAMKKAKVSSKDIVTLGITNQRGTFVVVDKDGKPLFKAITWQDRRMLASAFEEEWTKKLGRQRARLGGQAAVVRWIKDNEPEVFRKIYKFTPVNTYINFKLTGAMTTEPSNGALIFDQETLDLSKEMADAYGVPFEFAVKVVPSGTVIGEVTPEVAEQTGLKAGTPVVAGGGDQQCASVGTGAVRLGTMQATTGTGTFIEGHLGEVFKVDPKGRGFTMAAATPFKEYIVEMAHPSTGSALRWFRDEFCKEEIAAAEKKGVNAYTLIDDMAAKVKPGAEGLVFLPHLIPMSGAVDGWNRNASGIFFGVTFRTTKAHVARAVLEANAYEIRRCMATIEEMIESKITQITVTGGGAGSKVWNQIIADATGATVRVPEVFESTCLGAAILAAYGAGLYKDFYKAVDSMTRLVGTVKPNMANHDIYTKWLGIYEDVYKSLVKTYDEAAKIMQT